MGPETSSGNRLGGQSEQYPQFDMERIWAEKAEEFRQMAESLISEGDKQRVITFLLAEADSLTEIADDSEKRFGEDSAAPLLRKIASNYREAASQLEHGDLELARTILAQGVEAYTRWAKRG